MSLTQSFRHMSGRPALTASIVIAVSASVIGAQFMRASQAVLLGWCCAAVIYLVIAWLTGSRATVASMRKRAEQLDQGNGFIFCVTLGAALASVVAIVFDLSHVRSDPHELVLGAATLILSWFFVHTVFAFHYAHIYYNEPKSLEFPGAKDPRYGEFMYFALVVGMTAQVSDVTTGTSEMRRVVMTHGVISFFFNTAILALGVNLAASLVG